MFKGAPFLRLPHIPLSARGLVRHVSLGIVCLIFLLNYQPALKFPPVKTRVARAQFEQTREVEGKSLPFVLNLPHPGYLSTKFSKFHPGIDITSGLGMPIHPITPGLVVDAGFNFWGLGLIVSVDHGSGFKSLYAHMGQIYVKKGQTVSSTDTLGVVGITGYTSGPHTHLEISKDGLNTDPVLVLPTISDLPE